MRNYPPLLDSLAKFCDQHELHPKTKETHLGDANRILESLIAGLSEAEILELMAKHGFAIERSSYPSIIRTLKELINQRPR
jgi:hypothetical protein